jgi:Ran GTPase-activating protein (RanGAP) involved in mRNA processing and transport
MYDAKWSLCSNKNNRPWIELYIERFLGESLENLKPTEYNIEKVKALIELCTPFVRNLTIDHLEVAPMVENDSINDHIPFDIILEHLNELKSLSITYDCKTIGTQFYLSCTNISDNDLKKFVSGLSHTDLEKFKFHSSKLEPCMLKEIGRTLEKNAALVVIEMQNCRFGDAGLKNFCSILTHDSLPHIKHIILSNNFISCEGAKLLANILRRRKIETLDLKLNPIMTLGANEILSIANQIKLNKLNLSSCSFEEQIEETLLFVIKNNKHLHHLNISINKLSEELGVKIVSMLKFNSFLKKFDIRNTGISHKTKRIIDKIILENREKFNQIE